MYMCQTTLQPVEYNWADMEDFKLKENEKV